MIKYFKVIKKLLSKNNDLDIVQNNWMKGSLKTNFDFSDFSKKNLFNKLSDTSDYGFYYWPYGYLFRHVKWGGINSLGFRTDIEFENFDKINDIFQIGFFGGSTGFDILVPNEKTIVYKLENKLNSDHSVQKKIGKVKVINYSQPGNVIINQIINFIQFGQLANLKFVISHSSGNDFGAGLISDPKIVKKYKIVYLDILEAWSKKIHESKYDIDLSFSDINEKTFKPVEIKTDIKTSLDAYIFRVNQFSEIVNFQEKKFINGVMPHIFSKKKLSSEELKIKSNSNPYYQKMFDVLPKLYFELNKKFKSEKPNYEIINFHELFENLTDKKTHFGDYVHLLEEGNKIVAEHYFLRIKKMLEIS